MNPLRQLSEALSEFIVSRFARFSTRKLFILLAALFQLTRLFSQGLTQDQEAQIDQLFSWVNNESPGCVCTISRNGSIIFNRAYGLADLEQKIALNPASVFDAGSLVKQFVAATVLLLVEEGKLSLNDNIRKYIPEMAEYANQITIDHLLTHTSGVRDWVGLRRFSKADEDALSMVLRQNSTNFDPGTEWSYSNSGYVLLKEIVSRISGMTFGEFAQARLFNPLGMKNSTYSHEEAPNAPGLVLAYENRRGNWQKSMLKANERGGGGALLSTAGDLLIWNEALDQQKLGRNVTQKLQEPAKLKNGRVLSYARGLFITHDKLGRLVWHSGSAEGYKSLLNHWTDHGLSIAMMCNAGAAARRSAIAAKISRMLLANQVKLVEKSTPSRPTEPKNLDQRAGLYFNESGEQSLSLVHAKGQLRIAGGPVLEAIDQEKFRNPEGALSFMSSDEFEIHFRSDDAFELKSMEGEISRYSKAKAMEYDSKGLMVQPESSGPRKFPFKNVNPDTFQMSRMFIRFLRNNKGEVTGLDYRNPGMSRVRFVKE